MADLEPDKALALLESMVSLYGADQAEPSAKTAGAGKKDPEREAAARTAAVVHLAKRRIETLRDDWNRQRERELADLNDRLAAAEKLAEKDSGRAAAIYQAIIDLHQSDAWAAAVVAKARARMAELKK